MTNLFFMLFLVTRVAHWTPFLVDGQSMEPNLHSREIFVIDQSWQGIEEIKRGDIAVFTFDNQFFYVKRVIGMPGDTLKIGGDKVQLKDVDGQYQTLTEPYLEGQAHMYGDQRIFIVPPGEYFMMGDNREHSKDSRYFAYPYVKANQIYGKYLLP